MRELSLKEKQNIGFEILCAIDDFCKRNDIKYFMAYGTLLGAVRHGGFIPWDDDVDVIMPRGDYDKFIVKFNEGEKPDIYVCKSFDSGTFQLPYAKVMDSSTAIKIADRIDVEDLSAGVDVFPLDDVPTDDKKNYRISKKASFLFMLNRFRLYNKCAEVRKGRLKFLKSVLYFYSKLAQKTGLRKRILKYSRKKFKGEKCKYLFDENLRAAFRKSVFEGQTNLVFNGREFPAPVGYDEFLRVYYGDYMSLPAEDKRVYHSDEKTFKIE